MSLATLMSGAECAVQVNPLSQVLKHTDGDRSLQQVRFLARFDVATWGTNLRSLF